jgi:hypothetical protein
MDNLAKGTLVVSAILNISLLGADSAQAYSLYFDSDEWVRALAARESDRYSLISLDFRRDAGDPVQLITSIPTLTPNVEVAVSGRVGQTIGRFRRSAYILDGSFVGKTRTDPSEDLYVDFIDWSLLNPQQPVFAFAGNFIVPQGTLVIASDTANFNSFRIDLSDRFRPPAGCQILNPFGPTSFDRATCFNNVNQNFLGVVLDPSDSLTIENFPIPGVPTLEFSMQAPGLNNATFGVGNFFFAAVPEPTTVGGIILASGGLALLRRKRQKK